MKYKKVTKDDWDYRQCGSFWPKETKKGKPYLSGEIDLSKFGVDKIIKISINKNGQRKQEKHPSHYMYVQNDSLHHLRIPLETVEDDFMSGEQVNKDYNFVKDMQKESYPSPSLIKEEPIQDDVPDFDAFL
ncbi:hypothetical protein OAH00_00795 [bacterium]|nr:hypothetical protein [bacterium]